MQTVDLKPFTILEGSCLETLKTLPDNSIQMCVTSPPYFNLRDYGTGHWEGGDPNCQHQGKLLSANHNFNYADGRGSNGEMRSNICQKCGAVRVDEQIGLEETPEQFIQKLVDVFHEVKRVLKPDGTLWVNMGDSYCNSNGYERTTDTWKREGRSGAPANDRDLTSLHSCGYKTKDLIGIPWQLAFALRADDWYLRQDIIFAKNNPMPESVEDRCTKSHEYIFLLSKSPNYYFDYKAIEEEAISDAPSNPKFGGNKYGDSNDTHFQTYSGNEYHATGKRRKRDVWNVSVSNYKEAHFATYPIKLIEPCILAGSKPGDIVLDPFSGSGTTGIASLMHDRKYIGCELNPEYVKLSYARYQEEILGNKVVRNKETRAPEQIVQREILW